MSTDLDLEVALLEAEVDLLTRMADAGIVPPGARRQPTAGELRAGVLFAELDRIVEDAARVIARHAETVRTALIAALAGYLAPHAADAYAVLAALTDLADPMSPATIPGIRQVIDDTALEVVATLTETARQGGAQVIEEARRQGVPADLLPTGEAVDDTVRRALDAQAQRVASHPVTRALSAAVEAAQRAATGPEATGPGAIDAAVAAAEDASTAGTIDLARQAANVAHGQGRTNLLRTGPRAREVYASELLDRNTCTPCSHVDGKTYPNLAAGLQDYPGGGGFAECEGGSRCRGSLVVVWESEAAPTMR